MDAIREAHSLYDIYTVLGLTGKRGWIVCPFPDHAHKNNSPSFSIFTSPDGVQRFKCHGTCGRQGDVIDLVGYLNIPGYNPRIKDHVLRALSHLDQKFEIQPPKKVEKKPMAPNEWRRHLPPGKEVIAYAQTRGLILETLEKFKIGQHDHFMSIPTFEDEILTGIKFRSTWPEEKLTKEDLDHMRFWSAPGSNKGVFNRDAVAYTDKPVLVLKGEIPVMLCDQYGLLACAPNGGEGSYVEGLYNYLIFSARRVVVGDNDPDPKVRKDMQEAAERRARALQAELKFPPVIYKDIDEFILAEPEVALPMIHNWLED